jgi:hypothetical protein
MAATIVVFRNSVHRKKDDFMAIGIEILRPEDLLFLRIEAVNLELVNKKGKDSKLVVIAAAKPAYLIVFLAPQSIAEEAFYEQATITSQPQLNQNDYAPPPADTPDPGLGNLDDPLKPAGSVQHRLSGPTRLVFQLPKGMNEIPYTIESLLDWSRLQLVVSPVATGEFNSLPIPPPTILQTAIEMPYRLILSPDSSATWVHAVTPQTHAGRTELWHTRLGKIKVTKTGTKTKTTITEAADGHTIPLRAIWSPDFVDHGPLPPHTSDAIPFLMSMSPSDRAQIVILTSGTVGYFTRDANGEPEVFVPSPVQASRLFLSSQGGWLSSRGKWIPPAYYENLGRPENLVRKKLIAKSKVKSRRGREIFERIAALDLGEWTHLATGGRDHYVRIVYEGYLFPFGHRASLVKVTERKFVPPDASNGVTNVTAYLRQRMYIVVREPEITYDTSAYANQGREMPFWQQVRIKTLVTPDIDPPSYLNGGSNSFWVMVDKQPFDFHISVTDLAGKTIDALAKMIFVSDREDQLQDVQKAYLSDDARRACTVSGKTIAYADPSVGDTSLKTTELLFTVQPDYTKNASPPPLPYVSSPFLPALDSAMVSAPSIEHLLGITTSFEIQFYPGYLASGLDPYAGVYATIVAPVPVQFTADRAGGFATPNLLATALSARKGLVAGTPLYAAEGLVKPSEFFGNVQIEARLFGSIPLGTLVPVDTNNLAPADKNAPEIKTKSIPNAKAPMSLVTTVTWEPDLVPTSSAGIVTVDYNQDGQDSSLSLKTTITRFLTGEQPQSEVKGVLSNFMITLANVIGLTIDSITFTSKNGSKATVVAKLPSKNAVGFIGPLHFIQTLADVLPPGIFGGDGPTIQLQSTGIRVSYTLGLPPLTAGVFTLEHISLMTAVDLPYLDGKPAFEFGFASRKSPFLLTVECIGGGGFVHLIVDASGVQMVEGAFEFGAELSLDFGVASGSVHVMGGIYFKFDGSSSQITGFVDIGGNVSVLGIISVSIDLNLSLSYIHNTSGDKVQGRATLSISISLFFFSISVSVSVERSFGTAKGDPKMLDVISASDWLEYANAFA